MAFDLRGSCHSEGSFAGSFLAVDKNGPGLIWDVRLDPVLEWMLAIAITAPMKIV